MLWSVESNRVLPVSFSIECSDSLRYGDVYVYTSLYVSESSGKRYLSARKREVYDEHFTAPIGALVRAEYSYGSRRHERFGYRAWFVVEEVHVVERDD